MRFSAKKTDFGLGIWEVVIENNDWSKFLTNAKTTLLNNVQVQGFRKGKVPTYIALQQINESMILREASRMALKKGYHFASQQETDIKPVSEIKPSITELTSKKCIISYSFDIKFDMQINRYKGFNIEKNETKVSEEQIKLELKKVQERFTILENKKTDKVANGDHVIIDFVGKINNKEFAGGESKNYGLDIGSNSFIPGFEKALIGLTKNTEKTINLKFPDNYHVEDLRSKPVDFDIKINEIKIKKEPKLNDDLIKDMNIKEVDTVDKYKEYVKEKLTKELFKKEVDNFTNKLLREIAIDSKITIPNSIIVNQSKKLFNEFENKVKSQNMTIKEYCEKTGLSLEDINNELDLDSKKLIEEYYIMDYIASKESIQVSDDEVRNKYSEIAKQFSLPEKDKRLKQFFPENQIINEIKFNKIKDFLYKNN